MKTFKDLKIEDKIYSLDELGDLGTFIINGIIDYKLEHKYYYLYTLKGLCAKDPLFVKGSDTIIRKGGVTYYSNLEALYDDKSMRKDLAIDNQFKIALSAFRKIKRMSPNNDSLRNRIFNLFQMNQKYKWLSQLETYLNSLSDEEFQTIWKETEDFQDIGNCVENLLKSKIKK